ncbi:hypothetical protein FC789_15325 [Clostridium botulinum]|nr:hypothetical protein [Clostridium botulinum]
MKRKILHFIILTLVLNLSIPLITPIKCVKAVNITNLEENLSKSNKVDTKQVQQMLEDIGEISTAWSNTGFELNDLRDIASLPKKDDSFYKPSINTKAKSNTREILKKSSNIKKKSSKSSDSKPRDVKQQSQMIEYILGVAQNKYSNLIETEDLPQYVTYLYISHYIDNPYYTKDYTDFSNIMADCLTQDDINAYNSFIKTGRFSMFVSDLTNLSNIIYGNIGYTKEVASSIKNLKNITANTIYSAYQLENFDSDRFEKELNDVAIIFKENYSNATSQEELINTINGQLKPNTNYVQDEISIILDALFSITANSFELFSVGIGLTAMYINMYTDLLDRAAVASLQYSFSGRLAIRYMEYM